LISALVILTDRLTKTWVGEHVPMGGAIPIIPRVLRITHWTNDGAAFSMFADSASPATVRWFLIGFSLLAAVVVLVVMIRLGNRFTLTTVALALVFAGALGNVHDRIAYGSVIDFIEVHIFSYHWPDFNVADSSIVTGACLLMLDSLLPKFDEDSAYCSLFAPLPSCRNCDCFTLAGRIGHVKRTAAAGHRSTGTLHAYADPRPQGRHLQRRRVHRCDSESARQVDRSQRR
jgi:signal peptidase II